MRRWRRRLWVKAWRVRVGTSVWITMRGATWWVIRRKRRRHGDGCIGLIERRRNGRQSGSASTSIATKWGSVCPWESVVWQMRSCTMQLYTCELSDRTRRINKWTYGEVLLFDATWRRRPSASMRALTKAGVPTGSANRTNARVNLIEWSHGKIVWGGKWIQSARDRGRIRTRRRRWRVIVLITEGRICRQPIGSWKGAPCVKISTVSGEASVEIHCSGQQQRSGSETGFYNTHLSFSLELVSTQKAWRPITFFGYSHIQLFLQHLFCSWPCIFLLVSTVISVALFVVHFFLS